MRTGRFKTYFKRKPKSLIGRIKVLDNGCWEWTGGVSHGYGTVTFGEGYRDYTHRVLYVIFRGPIPEGLELDHLCRYTRCCNPWHLEPVTHVVNTAMGENFTAQQARRTHCPRGHELTDANTYRRKNRQNHRECRQCLYERNAKNRKEKRACRKSDADAAASHSPTHVAVLRE